MRCADNVATEGMSKTFENRSRKREKINRIHGENILYMRIQEHEGGLKYMIFQKIETNYFTLQF